MQNVQVDETIDKDLKKVTVIVGQILTKVLLMRY